MSIEVNLLPLITSIIILTYVGAYPGQKKHISTEDWRRIFIIIVYYVHLISLLLGIAIMTIVIMAMVMNQNISFFPAGRFIVPIMIVFLLIAGFFLLDVWIHLSYFGWSFSDDIQHQEWKMTWIIIMAWLSIIFFLSNIVFITTYRMSPLSFYKWRAVAVKISSPSPTKRRTIKKKNKN